MSGCRHLDSIWQRRARGVSRFIKDALLRDSRAPSRPLNVAALAPPATRRPPAAAPPALQPQSHETNLPQQKYHPKKNYKSPRTYSPSKEKGRKCVGIEKWGAISPRQMAVSSRASHKLHTHIIVIIVTVSTSQFELPDWIRQKKFAPILCDDSDGIHQWPPVEFSRYQHVVIHNVNILMWRRRRRRRRRREKNLIISIG